MAISHLARVRSAIDRLNAQSASVIYQQTALYPVLEIIVRIREKSRDQLGDLEAHILKFTDLRVVEQKELSFVTGFPEEKLVPILHELAGRGLLAPNSIKNTRFLLSDLGKLSIQYGVEVLEIDRVILLCGLTGRLLPRELYSMPALDPSHLKGSRYMPDFIQESAEIPLSYLNLGLIDNKRAVNIPDEAIEICGVLDESANPKFIECEILLFEIGGKTKVELYFSEGKVDWLDTSDVLGMLEPLGYPNNTPNQVIGAIAKELEELGLSLTDGGSLDSNGNPVFSVESAQDKFFEQKVAGRLYPLYVGTERLHARAIPEFRRILKGRTFTLLAATNSSFEKDIEIVRLIDDVITELRIRRQASSESLFDAITERANGHFFAFDEIKNVALRTNDKTLINAVTRQA